MNWVFSKLLRNKSTNQEIRLGNQNEFSGVISPNKPIAVTNEPVEFTGEVTGIPDSRPYKVYTALFYLDGTDPVVTELENTLSNELSWTFGGDGFFTLTPSITPFDSSNTFITVQTNGDDNETPAISYTAIIGGSIFLYTFDLNAASRTSAIGAEVFPCKVEIRVYN